MADSDCDFWGPADSADGSEVFWSMVDLLSGLLGSGSMVRFHQRWIRKNVAGSCSDAGRTVSVVRAGLTEPVTVTSSTQRRRSDELRMWEGT